MLVTALIKCFVITETVWYKDGMNNILKEKFSILFFLMLNELVVVSKGVWDVKLLLLQNPPVLS